MWTTIMNLLMLLAIMLLVLITGIGIHAYMNERRSWKEIESKASQSDIKMFDE